LKCISPSSILTLSFCPFWLHFARVPVLICFACSCGVKAKVDILKIEVILRFIVAINV